MACAVILSRAGRCSGDMGAVDTDTDTAAAQGNEALLACTCCECAPCRRPCFSGQNPYSRFVRTFLEGISFRTEILTVR